MSPRSLPLFLLLGGCLVLAEAPPGAKVNADCEDGFCEDGFTCDLQLDVCATACSDTQPCQDGFGCVAGLCADVCSDGDCPNHLACADDTTCFPQCFANTDCATDFSCCTVTKQASGKCLTIGACFE